MMDREQFKNACLLAGARPSHTGGIGTLGEKTLHAALKLYYEPDVYRHEVRIEQYVADIAGDKGIVEIQTQSFQNLRGKLAIFLELGVVTVVYPIAQVKWLCWIDGETGEVTKRRKSPKTGTVYDAFFELYKLKTLLPHPNLRLHFLLLEMTEYRFLDGWSTDRKKGSTRYERIPEALLEEVSVEALGDYAKLIPPGLPHPFTSKHYAKAARLTPRAAQRAIHVLHYVGALSRVGKVGNSYLYEPAAQAMEGVSAFGGADNS